MARTSTRTGGITFVAIVLIVLGCWSFVQALTQAPTLISAATRPNPPPRPPGEPPDATDLHRMCAKETATYYPVTGGLLVVDLLFAVGQIVCGIGLLKMKGGWRIPALLITLGKELFSWGGAAYQIIVLGPVIGRFMDETIAAAVPPGQPAQQMPFDLGMFVQALMGIVMAITIIVQVVILLTFTLILTSSSTKAAFAAAAAPPPAEEEEEEPREQRRRPRYEGYEDDDAPRQSPPETGITDRS